MRRAPLILLALLLLGAPALSRAGEEMDEAQNPKEYTDEDSQPLRFASYFVTPVGFLLEWSIVRPIHYLATNTILAHAFDSEYRTETPAAVAELPVPDYLPPRDPVVQPLPLREENLTAAPHSRASVPSGG
jgi:hypothetical protein